MERGENEKSAILLLILVEAAISLLVLAKVQLGTPELHE
jgi:hypothetical protein